MLGAPSFFLLPSIPLCKCTTVFLFLFFVYCYFFIFYLFFISVQLLYHSFLIHSLTDGHLGCFQHLAIVNCAAINIGVHKFFWIGVSGFPGCNPSSGIAGSKGSFIFSYQRKFHTAVNSGCTNLHSTNCVLGFPFRQNLSSTCFLLISSLWPL